MHQRTNFNGLDTKVTGLRPQTTYKMEAAQESFDEYEASPFSKWLKQVKDSLLQENPNFDLLKCMQHQSFLSIGKNNNKASKKNMEIVYSTQMLFQNANWVDDSYSETFLGLLRIMVDQEQCEQVDDTIFMMALRTIFEKYGKPNLEEHIPAKLIKSKSSNTTFHLGDENLMDLIVTLLHGVISIMSDRYEANMETFRRNKKSERELYDQRIARLQQEISNLKKQETLLQTELGKLKELSIECPPTKATLLTKTQETQTSLSQTKPSSTPVILGKPSMADIVKANAPSSALSNIQRKNPSTSSRPTGFHKLHIRHTPLLDSAKAILPIVDQANDFLKAMEELNLKSSLYFVSMINPWVVEVYVDLRKHEEVADVLTKNNVNIIKSFDSAAVKFQDIKKKEAIQTSIAKRIAYICVKTKNEDFHRFVRQGHSEEVLQASTKWIDHFRELHQKRMEDFSIP